MSNVKDDPNMEMPDFGKPAFIESPSVIVHGNDPYKYILSPHSFDPLLTDPRKWGIMVSDLIDHIAHMYSSAAGADQTAVSDEILRVARREHKFKAKDPSRGGLRGRTVFPKAN